MGITHTNLILALVEQLQNHKFKCPPDIDLLIGTINTPVGFVPGFGSPVNVSTRKLVNGIPIINQLIDEVQTDISRLTSGTRYGIFLMCYESQHHAIRYAKVCRTNIVPDEIIPLVTTNVI